MLDNLNLNCEKMRLGLKQSDSKPHLNNSKFLWWVRISMGCFSNIIQIKYCNEVVETPNTIFKKKDKLIC